MQLPVVSVKVLIDILLRLASQNRLFRLLICLLGLRWTFEDGNW